MWGSDPLIRVLILAGNDQHAGLQLNRIKPLTPSASAKTQSAVWGLGPGAWGLGRAGLNPPGLG